MSTESSSIDDDRIRYLSVEGDDGVIREYELPNGGISEAAAYRSLQSYLYQLGRIRRRQAGMPEPRPAPSTVPGDIVTLIWTGMIVGWILFFCFGPG